MRGHLLQPSQVRGQRPSRAVVPRGDQGGSGSITSRRFLVGLTVRLPHACCCPRSYGQPDSTSLVHRFSRTT